MSTIMETLTNDGRFNTLVSAIQAANLADTLAQPGPFTVFAPTDDAFAGLPEGTVDSMLTDVPGLTLLLTYHIVPGSLTSSDVLFQPTLKTVQGQELKVQKMGGRAYINDAQIIVTDITADNGTIHILDSVLLPPTP